MELFLFVPAYKLVRIFYLLRYFFGQGFSNPHVRGEGDQVVCNFVCFGMAEDEFVPAFLVRILGQFDFHRFYDFFSHRHTLTDTDKSIFYWTRMNADEHR